MSLVDVLMTVRKAGISIRPNGPYLRVSPQSKLTPEIVDLLQQHKPAILALLRRRGRVDDLQDICIGCGDLYVDLMGRGLCLRCVEPASGEVA